MVVIVNLKTSMFPPLTAAAVVINDYEDLEILKLLVRLAAKGRVHTSVGDSNVSKVTENRTWWCSRPSLVHDPMLRCILLKLPEEY